MRIYKGTLFAGLLLLGLAAIGGVWFRFGYADELERKIEIIVPTVQTEWWVMNWDTNEIECVLLVEHDELPKPNEVIYSCGEPIYLKWANTPSCTIPEDLPEGVPATCEGLYVFKASTRQSEKTVEVDLPLSSVLLSLSGCTLIPPENLCDEVPNLVFIGHEPLPNEQTIAIHIRTEDEEIDCAGARCEIPMPITTLEGVEIEFWGDSSYGDSSPTYRALVRMVDAGVSKIPGENLWYVDVLSTQWVGGEVAHCSQVWESLPPVGGPPLWLSTPSDPAELASAEPYAWLAGRLITNGVVDASSCADGGLLENGNANSCGVILAEEAVVEWQNQFDPKIVEIANKTDVPAYLLKNQFAVESQFWPGIWLPVEYGLGQITDNGADTALLWNEAFFTEFCPLILEAEACSQGYLFLDQESREILRGALSTGTDATCPSCDFGIDLTHAEFTIDVFANTVLGNCEQAGRIVRNTTGLAPGNVSSYEDLWRYTLVNYNAGPGCLSNAVQLAWRADRVLDWARVSGRLSAGCSQAIGYVEEIERIRTLASEQEPIPTASPTVLPDTTPTTTPIKPTPTQAAPYPPPEATPPYPSP